MIKIEVGDSVQEVKQFTFSGGEVQVRINPDVDYLFDSIKVHASIKNSNDVMALVMTMDALRYRTNKHTQFYLIMPYLPYARQDRRCQKGESLACNRFIDLINSLKFNSVELWDVHNEGVLPLFTSDIKNVSQYKIVAPIIQEYDIICAPDKGAAKKLPDLRNNFFVEYAVANKVRDPATGHITHTEIVYSTKSIKGKSVLIVDDICDGGRTFIELAKVLREEGATTVGLYITHGIFSKGLDVFDGLIDNIYTTKSFYEGDDPRVTIV